MVHQPTRIQNVCNKKKEQDNAEITDYSQVDAPSKPKWLNAFCKGSVRPRDIPYQKHQPLECKEQKPEGDNFEVFF